MKHLSQVGDVVKETKALARLRVPHLQALAERQGRARSEAKALALDSMAEVGSPPGCVPGTLVFRGGRARGQLFVFWVIHVFFPVSGSLPGVDPSASL